MAMARIFLEGGRALLKGEKGLEQICISECAVIRQGEKAENEQEREAVVGFVDSLITSPGHSAAYKLTAGRPEMRN